MREFFGLVKAFLLVVLLTPGFWFKFCVCMSAYNLTLVFIRLEERNLIGAIFSGFCACVTIGSAVVVFKSKLYQARAKKPFPKYEEKA